MLTPNSSPDRPQSAALAATDGSRAPPPQKTRSPSRSIVASSPSSLIARPWNPSSATSRFEPEPISPTDRPSPAAQASSSISPSAVSGRANQSAAPPVRTVVSRASGKSAPHSLGRRAHAALLHQRLAELEDVAGADRHQPALAGALAVAVQALGEGLAGAVAVGQPPDRPPAHPLRRGLGDRQPADPGQLADRLLAGRVDVEHRDLVGEGEGRAELLGERLGARVEVRLEDGEEAPRAQLAQGRAGPPAPRSGGGRSRRRCGIRRACPSARAAVGRRGSRASARGRGASTSQPGQLDRGEGGAGVGPVVAAGDGQRQLGRPRRRRRRSRAVAASPARSSRPPSAGSTTPRAGAAKRRNASCSSASEPQRAWWSISTLVTTAISGSSSRKLASLSSASATTHSPSPQPALAAAPLAQPRHLAADEEGGVGADRPQRPDRHRGGRRLAVGAGDRDQPLLRAELGQQGAAVDGARPRARGPRPAPGCSASIAVETTTSASAGRLAASWPTAGSQPGLAQALHVRGVGAVAAGDRRAEAGQTSARPLIPAPPMPMKCRRRCRPRGVSAALIRPPPGPRRRSGARRRASAERRAAARPSPPAAAGRRAARRPRLGEPPGAPAPRRRSPSPRPARAIQAALARWWSAVACG